MQVHARCAGSRLLPRQPGGLHCRAPHPAPGPGRRARGAQTVYARGGRGQQGRLQQSVQPAPTGWLPNPLANAPWYAGAPAVLLVAFLAVKYRKYARRLYKKVYRRIRGYNYYDDDEDDDEDDESMYDFESRGFWSPERGMTREKYEEALRNGTLVDPFKVKPLTEEQILAARRRRSKEWEGSDLDLTKREIPENHPFAYAAPVSEEDEELQRHRLRVRRGPPLQDLSGKRGYPEDRPVITPGRPSPPPPPEAQPPSQ